MQTVFSRLRSGALALTALLLATTGLRAGLVLRFSHDDIRKEVLLHDGMLHDDGYVLIDPGRVEDLTRRLHREATVRLVKLRLRTLARGEPWTRARSLEVQSQLFTRVTDAARGEIVALFRQAEAEGTFKQYSDRLFDTGIIRDEILQIDRRNLLASVLGGFRAYSPTSRSRIESLEELVGERTLRLVLEDAVTWARDQYSRRRAAMAARAVEGRKAPGRDEAEALARQVFDEAVEHARAKLRVLAAEMGREVPKYLYPPLKFRKRPHEIEGEVQPVKPADVPEDRGGFDPYGTILGMS